MIETLSSLLPPSITMYSSGSYPCFKTERIVSSRNRPWLYEGVTILSFKAMRAYGPSGFEVLDRFDHVGLLSFSELWIDWQCQCFACRVFRLRKLTLLVTEIGETFLAVQRNWIIHFCAHAMLLQMFH